MTWSRHDKDRPTDNETESMTDADTYSLFNRSDDGETEITSTADTNSPSEIDDVIDNNISLFDNEVRHPPKHYLNKVANLEV
jgi:hypothetical protein